MGLNETELGRRHHGRRIREGRTDMKACCEFPSLPFPGGCYSTAPHVRTVHSCKAGQGGEKTPKFPGQAVLPVRSAFFLARKKMRALRKSAKRTLNPL